MTRVFRWGYSKRNTLIILSFAFYVIITIYAYQTSLPPMGYADIRLLEILRYILFGIFCIDFIIDLIKKKRRLNFLIIISLVISICSIIAVKNIDILLLVMVLVEMGKFKFDDVIKVVYYFVLILYFIIVLGSVLGFIPNLIYNRDEETYRYSLGFIYPTITSTLFMFILLMKYYLKKFDVSVENLLCDTILIGIIYYLTKSRTGFVLSLIIIIFAVLLKISYLKKININKIIQNKYVKGFLISIPILIFVGWFILVVMYANGPNFAETINNFLSGRLYYTLEAFKKYKVLPFGLNINMSGWGGYGYYVEVENFEYFFLDNSYSLILFTKGSVILLAAILLFTYVIYKAIKDKNYIILFILFIVLLNSIVEPYLIEVSINVFLIYTSSVFYKKSKYYFIK